MLGCQDKYYYVRRREEVVIMSQTDFGKKVEKLVKSLDKFAADLINNTQKVVTAAQELRDSQLEDKEEPKE